MVLLADLNFDLPLRNPVIIFSIVLFIILFAPIIFNKIKVPHIIGLILAGIIIGPYGFNLLLRDSSIVLFGTVGLQYIMFTAGLEIDILEFKKNTVKSIVFGLFTFLIPMLIGIPAAYYILQFSMPASILLACLFASHTLLAYPIASKYGISRIRSVTLTIGGTIITDILALLVLAAVTGTYKGDVGPSFWIRLGISTLIFGAIVVFVFPLIARWFLKKFDDNISQYIFVLAMVFLGAFLAEAAGLEAIIGAFLAGLSLNKFIPYSSALMHRIDFVGNAFFIPFFLISVGMLVDFKVTFKGGALTVAGVMIVLAIAAKYISAWLTQKTFRLSKEERQMVFGLSTARVGATLAVVLVGYNLIIGEAANGDPIRLLNEDVLNGTVLMILVTCTVSSFVVEKVSRNLALHEESKQADTPVPGGKILISLAYPETVIHLIDFGLMLKPRKSAIPVYTLNIITEESGQGNTKSVVKKMMDKAVSHAAASEQIIQPLIRYDANISNGVIYTIKEQGITDLVIGLHQQANEHDFLGEKAERILRSTSETVFIYKAIQPFNTLTRMVVVVTPNAELEPGFDHWFTKLTTIGKEAGLAIDFFATSETSKEFREQQKLQKIEGEMVFHLFSEWNDFLIFTREVKKNDLLIIVSSRKGHISYQSQLDRLPYYLFKYFLENSFIILYPKQIKQGIKMDDVQIFRELTGGNRSRKSTSIA